MLRLETVEACAVAPERFGAQAEAGGVSSFIFRVRRECQT